MELYRGGIGIPDKYKEVKKRLYNIEIALEEEKSCNNTFHTGAPIPPRRNNYVPPQRQASNYNPPNPTPTQAQTYSRQGQAMDLSRSRTQVACRHCGKLGYHISKNCKGDCKHCHRKHPGRWCNIQPPPRRPYNSQYTEMVDFSTMTAEQKEELKKAVGF